MCFSTGFATPAGSQAPPQKQQAELQNQQQHSQQQALASQLPLQPLRWQVLTVEEAQTNPIGQVKHPVDPLLEANVPCVHQWHALAPAQQTLSQNQKPNQDQGKL